MLPEAQCYNLLAPILWVSLLFVFFFFQESIVDEQESNKDENIHLRRFLRVLANILIICCLCGSGYLIYFVVKRSQTFSKMQNVGWYERNEVWKLSFQFSDVITFLVHQHNHCHSQNGWHPKQRDSPPWSKSPSVTLYLCYSGITVVSQRVFRAN